MWIPVLFGGGIALYFSLKGEPVLWAGGVPCVVFAGALAALYRYHHENVRWFAGYLAVFAAFLIAAGFFAAQVETRISGTPILVKKTGAARIAGDVVSVEKLEGGKGSRVVLEDVVLEDIAPEDTPRRVRLTFRKDAGLAAGQRISTLGELDAPSRAVSPGGYDFRRHFFYEGIGGVGFAYKQAEILRPAQMNGAGIFFERLRTRIMAEIMARAGPRAGAVMGALITGERGGIPDEDNEAMRDSGLYHLLSISGAHVGMVAGVLFFFTRLALAAWPYVALRFPIKKIAAGIAIAGAAFYVVLAGADVPAVRSLMMTGLVMAAVMLDRSPFSLRLVAFAAFVILIFSPHSVAGVSFQMSFAAVAALIAFFDWTRPWWSGWQRRSGFLGRAGLYLAGVLLTSLIAGGMSGLFSLYHFQNFSLYGVLANMIAVPLTAIVIMPAAVVALILMPLGMAGPALMVMEWGSLWMLGIAHWTAGLDGAVLHVKQWPEVSFALICAGVVLLIVWRGWSGKALAGLLILAAFAFGAAARAPDILIADGGKMQAVRGADGAYYFSTLRRDKFAAENWMRQAGRADEAPKSFSDAGAPMLCDAAGCRMEQGGARVAIVRHVSALREDCAWADLVVAEIPVRARQCAGADVIVDLFASRDGGAQAVWIEGRGKIRVRSAAAATGDRPWK